MIVEVRRERLTFQQLDNLLGHDPIAIHNHGDCIRRSAATWLGYADGVEAAAVGVIPRSIFEEEAYLWMIHTKICEQHPLRFVRWSRKVIDEVLDLYPTLYGLCLIDNPSGNLWLRWLGAKFDDRSFDGFDRFRISKW